MIEPYNKSNSIVEYSRKLADIAHDGIKRDTGEPYIVHPVEVADILCNLVSDSRYKTVSSAAGLLHDVAEDVEEFEVFNPYRPLHNRFRRDKIYLNDLLEDGNDIAQFICYVVDKVTFRQDVTYAEYMDRIFTIEQEHGIIRALDIIAALLKFVDRKVNSIPGEQLREEEVMKEYYPLKDADKETLRQFYKRKKITDSFIEKGGIFYDEELYWAAMQNKFATKKAANAWDNLLTYIPEIEALLLLNSNLFSQERLQTLVDNCMINSVEIIANTDLSNKLDIIHIVSRTGMYRGRKFEKNYMHRLKHLRYKLREGKQ